MNKQSTITIGNETLPLDRSWIVKTAAEHGKIQLIKAYRQLAHENNRTDIGLKEAKEAIESCIFASITNQWPATNEYSFNVDKLLTLFNKFLDNETELKKRLNEGINAALDGWKIMGFNSPFDAVRMVVDNIEKCT